MMGIFDDKVEVVEAQAQLQPFNLEQLNHTICILEQRHEGLDVSSVADLQENRNPVDQQQPQNQYPQDGPRLQHPTTPKELNMFESLKSLRYDGNMLISWARSRIYWDHQGHCRNGRCISCLLQICAFQPRDGQPIPG